MAILGTNFIDLIDIYKRQGGDGEMTGTIIEMLSQTNGILDDAMAMECNNGTKHRTTTRTGLPPVAWGKLYQGITQGKSTTQQVEDTTGFVEGLSSVDTRLLELSNNEAQVRLSEAQSYLEAMNQEAASTIFYGNSSIDAEEFMGFAPRFSSLSADNGNQIIDAGGTGSDNTSIWFVTWGDSQCHLLYPKGTQAGVTRQDKGEQRVLDSDGAPYYVKEELFRWNLGLSVRDWRYVSRVANIDVSALQADPTDVDGNGNDLYHFMRKAYYKLQNRRVAGGKISIYCNRDVLEALDALGTNSGSSDTFVRLRPMEIQGKEVMTYRGMPIRETDAILNTETQVS